MYRKTLEHKEVTKKQAAIQKIIRNRLCYLLYYLLFNFQDAVFIYREMHLFLALINFSEPALIWTTDVNS